jgi:hypothetical protein
MPIPEMRVMFETDGEGDYSNAIVIREAEDTARGYALKSKMFLMACVIGLLDEV